MNIKRILGKCRRGLDVVTLNAYASYSQAGEDRIVSYLLNQLGISKPTYLDIGANEPVISNNTYMFYDRGGKGVCIEPDPEMFRKIKKARPRDTALNVGIGLTNAPGMSFYLFPGKENGWSTFSEKEAKLREAESGIKYKVITVPVRNINDIIAENFTSAPDFISLDVEGMDLEILQSLDFQRFQPEIICVETITFSITNTEEKLDEISAFMHSKGYYTYGDTHVNTIFCRKTS